MEFEDVGLLGFKPMSGLGIDLSSARLVVAQHRNILAYWLA